MNLTVLFREPKKYIIISIDMCMNDMNVCPSFVTYTLVNYCSSRNDCVETMQRLCIRRVTSEKRSNMLYISRSDKLSHVPQAPISQRISGRNTSQKLPQLCDRCIEQRAYLTSVNRPILYVSFEVFNDLF